jgi:hypothetical protein
VLVEHVPGSELSKCVQLLGEATSLASLLFLLDSLGEGR